MSRPALAKYPHLRQILKNDPTANQQFNQVVSELQGQVAAPRSVEAELNRQTVRLNEILKQRELERGCMKDQELVITMLGETIEPQVHLRPYTQDIAKDSHYEVKFSAHEIREILRLHWRLIAEQAEATIRGTTTADIDQDE